MVKFQRSTRKFRQSLWAACAITDITPNQQIPLHAQFRATAYPASAPPPLSPLVPSSGQVLLQGSSAGCLSDLLPKTYSSGVALTCKPLVRTSPPHSERSGCEGASAVAPLYTYLAAAGGQVQVASSTLQCDVLCYAPCSMLLSEVGPKVLRPALQQQVAAMSRAMEEHGRVLQVWSWSDSEDWGCHAKTGQDSQAAKQSL